jgi:WD40 repeat protein
VAIGEAVVGFVGTDGAQIRDAMHWARRTPVPTADSLDRLEISAGDHYLALYSDEDSVAIFDVPARAPVPRPRVPGRPLQFVNVDFSADGTRALTTDGRSVTQLWRLPRWVLLPSPGRRGEVMTMSPDGRWLAVEQNKGVAIYGADEPRSRRHFLPHCDLRRTFVLMMMRDSTDSALGHAFWGPSSRHLIIQRGDTIAALELGTWIVKFAHRGVVMSMDPQATYLLAGTPRQGANLSLFDVLARSRKWASGGGPGSQPDTTTATVYDTRSWEPVWSHPGVFVGLGRPEFSDDGRYLMYATDDGSYQFLELPATRITGPSLRVADRTAVFSPDGRYFVTVSGDSTVRVWETHSPTCDSCTNVRAMLRVAQRRLKH